MRWTVTGLVVAAGLSACATTANYVAPPDAAKSATIVNLRSILRPGCEKADMKLFHGISAAPCRAFLSQIDDRVGSPTKKENQVSVGTHHLVVECVYSLIGPQDRGLTAPVNNTTRFDYAFDKPMRYYIRAEMVDDVCKISMSDSPAPPLAPLWRALW